MKLFCRYIGGLSAGHVSYSLGRLKYIAIYRIHSAGSNIYRNISDAIDFKSNNNFHRSNLSIIFHFYFLLANQLEPPNNILQVIINQPLSCEHPWRKKSFVEPKAVLGSVKSSSWKFFNFRVSGENRRNIHFNKALRHSNEHLYQSEWTGGDIDRSYVHCMLCYNSGNRKRAQAKYCGGTTNLTFHGKE